MFEVWRLARRRRAARLSARHKSDLLESRRIRGQSAFFSRQSPCRHPQDAALHMAPHGKIPALPHKKSSMNRANRALLWHLLSLPLLALGLVLLVCWLPVAEYITHAQRKLTELEFWGAVLYP